MKQMRTWVLLSSQRTNQMILPNEYPEREILNDKAELGSNLGPNTAKLDAKPRTMTQNKARQTNKIDFLQLPWAQEVRGSNPRAPTTNLLN